MADASMNGDTPRRDVVGALLLRQGEVLLGLRAPHRSFGSTWDIIGGHIERGEKPLAALSRELWEELRINMLSWFPLGTIPIDDPPRETMRLNLFVVDRWSGTPAICDDEHTALGWFAPHQAAALPNLASPRYRSILRRLPAMMRHFAASTSPRTGR